MISLVVYVHDSHVEKVKEAMFREGAGHLGNYDQCCWQTEGMGQFRALDGANPFLGEVGKLERTKEWKVEIVCPPEKVKAVVEAMKKAHPYETPAFLVTDQLHS